MEATDHIKTLEFWENDTVEIRFNPKSEKRDPQGISRAIQQRGIKSSIVLASSGSSGDPKLVVLSKSAILASARAVNDFCTITADDIWLGGLSTFHIGGLAIYARASLSGSRVIEMPWDQWTKDGSKFLSVVSNATITSLTPVHLYDLVSANLRCPKNLRGVFIGGGALSTELAARARDLGWPLWTTYGMTESASQVATSLEGAIDWLPILPHWETRISDQGQLMIKGPALMSGYFTKDLNWIPATDESGYYKTGDLVEIKNNNLKPLGRSDDQIKILGELVSINKLEKSLSDHLGRRTVIFGTPDKRRGATLTAVIESGDEMSTKFQQWNLGLPGYERIDNIYYFANFPRTELGKIDRNLVLQTLHSIPQEK